MYCDNCGNKLRDGAKFCNKCGTPVTQDDEESVVGTNNHTIPIQQRQTVHHTVSQPQPRPYYAPGTHPYHQLGGFLSFIVVTNYICGGLALAAIIPVIITYVGLLQLTSWMGRYATSFSGLCVFGMIGAIVLMIVAASIMFSFANRIRHKESSFLRYIQSGSITIMIIGIIYVVITMIWAKSFDVYGVMGNAVEVVDLIEYVVSWLVGFILTSVYFGKSVRVRTYMGSDDYLKQSLFNKNSHPIPADGSDQYPNGVPNKENESRMSSFDPNTQWVCPQCNRVNSNYVTTCQCGLPKPQIDMSNSWVCKNCGTVNMGNLHRCTSCGSFKNEETSWTCAKCGARNMGSANTCSSCYAPKEISKSSKTPIGQRDWQCPQCKRINPGYVTTCTCGCPSSMGVKLDSYSGGTAPTVPNSDEWKCPHCGKINANYVGTCGCGQTKP